MVGGIDHVVWEARDLEAAHLGHVQVADHRCEAALADPLQGQAPTLRLDAAPPGLLEHIADNRADEAGVVDDEDSRAGGLAWHRTSLERWGWPYSNPKA